MTLSLRSNWTEAPPAVLELKGQSPVAVGNRRLVYQHPHLDGLLVKVMRPELYDETGQPVRRKRWKGRRREGVYAYFTREILEFVALRAQTPRQRQPLPICAVFGVAETDLGLGLLVERVGLPNGSLAPSLREVVAGDGPVQVDLHACLEDFFRDLTDRHVVVYELTPDNVVLRQGEPGGPRFVCIDGMGSRTLVPLASWSKRANARRIAKYRRQLMHWLEAEAPSLSNGASGARIDSRA